MWPIYSTEMCLVSATHTLWYHITNAITENHDVFDTASI